MGALTGEITARSATFSDDELKALAGNPDQALVRQRRSDRHCLGSYRIRDGDWRGDEEPRGGRAHEEPRRSRRGRGVPERLRLRDHANQEERMEYTLKATRDETMIRVEAQRDFDEEGRPKEVIALIEYPISHPQVAGLDDDALNKKLKDEARDALRQYTSDSESVETLDIDGDKVKV